MPINRAAATACGPNSVSPDFPGRVTEASCHNPIFCGARLQVREVAAEAIARARRGDGPTLIEAETYRFRGHSLADPDELRQKDEKDHYQVRVPCTVAELPAGGSHVHILRGASSLWWARRAPAEGGEGPLPGAGPLHTMAKLLARGGGMHA